jgi:transcriptional regulator with XRE-family HTH domain
MRMAHVTSRDDDERGHEADHDTGSEKDEDEFFTNLSLAVRAQRRVHRIDQRTLAARAGVSKSTVARIERGDSAVALSTLRRVLAEVGLGVVLVDEDGYPWQDGRALPVDIEGGVDGAEQRLPEALVCGMKEEASDSRARRLLDEARVRNAGGTAGPSSP